MSAVVQLGAGQSIEINVTKYLTYTITNDGWGPTIKATKGPIFAKTKPDGSLSIGCSAPAEDDEV